MNFIWSKLGWKGDYSRARPLSFANQWIVQDIPIMFSFSYFSSFIYRAHIDSGFVAEAITLSKYLLKLLKLL